VSYQKERDEFIARASQVGIALDTIHLLLRYASTLQRLAVAQCNGDYPADNGKRKVIPCPQCEAGFVASSFKRVAYMTEGPGGRMYYKRICPDCYAQERVRKILAGSAYIPEFGGDPRGAVLRLFAVGTSRNDIESGRERGIYVPARER
jgi:hypothetical protein